MELSESWKWVFTNSLSLDQCSNLSLLVGSVDVHELTNDSTPTSAEVSHSSYVSPDYLFFVIFSKLISYLYMYDQMDIAVSADGFAWRHLLHD